MVRKVGNAHFVVNLAFAVENKCIQRGMEIAQSKECKQLLNTDMIVYHQRKVR